MRDDELQVLGLNNKRKSHWPWVVVCICLIIIAILSWLLMKKTSVESLPSVKDEGTTIVPTLQEAVDSLLRERLMQVSGLHGQVIVMEVETGAIKAMVGLERRYDGQYVPCNNFGYQQEQGKTFATASLLAAMETGEIKMDDNVDTGNGVWVMDDDFTMRDHNYYHGGYGQLPVGLAFEFSSNIGISKSVLKAFHYDVNAYFAQLEKMSFGQPDSIDGIPGLCPVDYYSPKECYWRKYLFPLHIIGFEGKMAPIQLLTFYNAIANDGKMVKPTIKPRTPVVINEQIASAKSIKEIRTELFNVVHDGLGRRAGTDMVEVAGRPGSSTVNVIWGEEGDEDAVEENQLGFCGYFPADKPKYSIIVSMNIIWGPRSGGLVAGTAFKQIVEWMCEHGFI